MRIIAGELRGRRITVPPRGTRPLLDRVREALFAVLAGRFEGSGVLDLFAGSGSLGLEALSRGASSARFVEGSAGALAVLRRNVEQLGLAQRARIVRGDALRQASWRERGDVLTRYAAVFLDPPYAICDEPAVRQKLLAALEQLAGACLDPDGVIVLHVPAGAEARLRIPACLSAEVRTYGSSCVIILGPRAG